MLEVPIPLLELRVSLVDELWVSLLELWVSLGELWVSLRELSVDTLLIIRVVSLRMHLLEVVALHVHRWVRMLRPRLTLRIRHLRRRVHGRVPGALQRLASVERGAAEPPVDGRHEVAGVQVESVRVVGSSGLAAAVAVETGRGSALRLRSF